MLKSTFISYAIATFHGIFNGRCLAAGGMFPQYRDSFSISVTEHDGQSIIRDVSSASNYFNSVNLVDPRKDTLVNFPLKTFDKVTVGISFTQDKEKNDAIINVYRVIMPNINFTIAEVYYKVIWTQNSFDDEVIHNLGTKLKDCFKDSVITYVDTIENIMSHVDFFKLLPKLAFTISLYEPKFVTYSTILLNKVLELRKMFTATPIHLHDVSAPGLDKEKRNTLFNDLAYVTCNVAPVMTVTYFELLGSLPILTPDGKADFAFHICASP